ncbi:MAG: alpha/beta fold hydrolase [Planctomycetaceae bacterium]
MPSTDSRIPEPPYDVPADLAQPPRPSEEIAGEPPASGCPSPVPWRQVIDAFHTEARHWKLDRGRYELEGSTWGEGPPLYFLHGLTAKRELFSLLVWLLRDTFRCVMIDLPGSRRGRPTRGWLSAGDIASDLFAAADFHGDERFQLFASSFSSIVALEALSAGPNRIERAVLQGGFAHLNLSLTERILIRLGLLMPGHLNILIFRRTIQAYSHKRWFPPFDHGRWDLYVKSSGEVPMASIARRAAIIRDYDGRPKLPQIRQPVMLIRSEGEGIVSSTAHEELASGLPNARTEWLHSSGHLPFLTHPHRLANLVRPFYLGETPAESCDDTACGSSESEIRPNSPSA